MSREYGGQWLSSTTRHVRIYAADIDPETNAFDQTQMDQLTLMLDPQRRTSSREPSRAAHPTSITSTRSLLLRQSEQALDRNEV